MLLVDSDAVYTSAPGKEVLEQNDVAMSNVVAGDHNAMCIIDNCALRLKLFYATGQFGTDRHHMWANIMHRS